MKTVANKKELMRVQGLSSNYHFRRGALWQLVVSPLQTCHHHVC